MITTDKITVLNAPIEADWGTWLLDHPDCDTICEDVIVGKVIRIFAYANSSAGNVELKKYRNDIFRDKKIIKGLSKNAVLGII